MAAPASVLPVTRWLRDDRLRGWIFLVSATALVAYEQLAPRTMVWSVAHLQPKAVQIEWVPFAAYYWSDLSSALFDAGKKLLLGGIFGSALRSAGCRQGLWVALAAGALFEIAQLLTTTRCASVSDVLLLAAGVVVGGLVYRYYCLLVFSSYGRQSDVLDSDREDVNGSEVRSRDGGSA